jgi:hypothetical protein
MVSTAEKMTVLTAAMDVLMRRSADDETFVLAKVCDCIEQLITADGRYDELYSELRKNKFGEKFIAETARAYHEETLPVICCLRTASIITREDEIKKLVPLCANIISSEGRVCAHKKRIIIDALQFHEKDRYRVCVGEYIRIDDRTGSRNIKTYSKNVMNERQSSQSSRKVIRSSIVRHIHTLCDVMSRSCI